MVTCEQQGNLPALHAWSPRRIMRAHPFISADEDEAINEELAGHLENEIVSGFSGPLVAAEIPGCRIHGQRLSCIRIVRQIGRKMGTSPTASHVLERRDSSQARHIPAGSEQERLSPGRKASLEYEGDKASLSRRHRRPREIHGSCCRAETIRKKPPLDLTCNKRPIHILLVLGFIPKSSRVIRYPVPGLRQLTSV